METIKPNQRVISECIKFLSTIEVKKFLIAFSGGCDSSVLLHSMCSLRKSHNIKIKSIHINHHYTNESKSYSKHCSLVAQQYGLEHITDDVYLDSNSNIEEQLREKRYEIITDIAEKNEYILTGHHLDDQVETFFLRLMRGASSRGLTCMSIFNSFNNKIIARPLLNVDRLEIELYQKNNSIKFIKDESNESFRFDRNFIRKEIIPKLKSRWLGLNKIMKNNIRQQEINFMTLKDHITTKLKNCFDGENNKLSIKKVKLEEDYIKFSIVHEWVNINTGVLLNYKQINEILTNIIGSRNVSTPSFSFLNFTIRKYQETLYLHIDSERKQSEDPMIWDLTKDLRFNHLTLKISKLKELGIYKFLLINKPVTVKRREGGEKIKLNPKFHHKLKKIFQSKKIPLWERDTYALIFAKEQLIAAYGPNDVIISNTKH